MGTAEMHRGLQGSCSPCPAHEGDSETYLSSDCRQVTMEPSLPERGYGSQCPPECEILVAPGEKTSQPARGT